jgi:hypothetical protein
VTWSGQSVSTAWSTAANEGLLVSKAGVTLDMGSSTEFSLAGVCNWNNISVSQVSRAAGVELSGQQSAPVNIVWGMRCCTFHLPN